jgi:hypothetical protein
MTDRTLIEGQLPVTRAKAAEALCFMCVPAQPLRKENYRH